MPTGLFWVRVRHNRVSHNTNLFVFEFIFKFLLKEDLFDVSSSGLNAYYINMVKITLLQIIMLFSL